MSMGSKNKTCMEIKGKEYTTTNNNPTLVVTLPNQNNNINNTNSNSQYLNTIIIEH